MPKHPLVPALKSRLSCVVAGALCAVGVATGAQADTLPQPHTLSQTRTLPRAAAVPAHVPVAPARDEAPAVFGRAAHLVDLSAGEVRFSKDADRRLPVASLTKVMTAYIVLREAEPTDTVKVTGGDVRYGSRDGATVAHLRAGDRLTVRDMLHALLLPSGADAARVLARTYGPGVPAFTAKMNATARELGMRDTLYINADGMPGDGGGHSTARDQVRLADVALRNATLRAITSTRYHTLPQTPAHHAYAWKNTNKLLGDPGTIGVKTGYTRASGYSLAFAADRDNRRLIGVLIGETDSARRFTTARALLDWATTDDDDA